MITWFTANMRTFWQVTRDVPMYMMVSGDRAELRGLNLEGMRRLGFSDLEVLFSYPLQRRH